MYVLSIEHKNKRSRIPYTNNIHTVWVRLAETDIIQVYSTVTTSARRNADGRTEDMGQRCVLPATKTKVVVAMEADSSGGEGGDVTWMSVRCMVWGACVWRCAPHPTPTAPARSVYSYLLLLTNLLNCHCIEYRSILCIRYCSSVVPILCIDILCIRYFVLSCAIVCSPT